ncbi:hypothetical protein V5E97_24870 [Singulisphaera sp. Ch08]|uniref:Uncharacterized protein n=1 Tax=Singulisphaera sp. Ch08 TaxID=3120278 RepID=A0AAU7C8T3_9BACT
MTGKENGDIAYPMCPRKAPLFLELPGLHGERLNLLGRHSPDAALNESCRD